MLEVLEAAYPTFLPRDPARRNGSERTVACPAGQRRSHRPRDRQGRRRRRARRPRSWRRCSPSAGPRRSRRCGRPPTSCAPSSPATSATFVVNRNINFTNVCTVGCAFCGFGQTQPLPRRLPARAATSSPSGCARRSSSARPRSACRAGSTPTTRSSTTASGCGWPRRWRPTSTSTPTRRWRSTSCASAPAAIPDYVFGYLRELRARLDAGHGRRGARGRRPRSGSRRTSCRRVAGSRSSRPPTAPGCARPRR